jgi:hypothetical protein
VAEGVLLCEDVLPVPADVFVRSEALRDRRNDEPMSVTEDAIECLLAWLRVCGVVGTLGLFSYWLGTRGVSSGVVGPDAGGRLSAGGGVVLLGEVECECEYEYDRDERAALEYALGVLLPKNEGRREKSPVELWWCEVWSAIACRCHCCGDDGTDDQGQGFVAHRHRPTSGMAGRGGCSRSTRRVQCASRRRTRRLIWARRTLDAACGCD